MVLDQATHEVGMGAVSLRLRLILLVVLAILPMAGVKLVSAWEERQRALQAARQSARSIAGLVVQEKLQLADQTQMVLRALAENDAVRLAVQPRCAQVLKITREQYRAYNNLGVADRQGNLLCSAVPPPRPVQLSDRPYFQEALRTGQLTVGDGVVSRVTGNPVITYALPVVNASGAIDRLLLASIDLQWLNQFMARTPLSEGSVLYLTDGQGRVLSRVPEGNVGPSEVQVNEKLPVGDVLAWIQGGGGDGELELVGPDGVERLYFIHTFGQEASYYVLGVPLAQIWGPVQARLLRELAALGLLLVGLLGLTTLYSRNLILRPVGQLVAITDRLAAGDLAARSEFSRRDPAELLQLSTAINCLAQGLQLRELDGRRVLETLRQNRDQLTTLIETIPEGIVILNRMGKISFANAAAEAILRLQRHDLTGREYDDPQWEIRDLQGQPLPPEELPFSVVMRTGQPVRHFRHSVVNPDGVMITLSINAAPLIDEFGNPQSVIAALEDITPQMQDEARLRRLVRALQILGRANQELVRAANETQLMESICHVMVEEGGYRMAWVGYADEEAGHPIRCVAQAGYDEGYLAHIHLTWDDREGGQGAMARAIRSGQVQVTEDIVTDPTFIALREQALQRGYRSTLALPLVGEGRIFGVLGIYAGAPHAFDAEEIELLEHMADDMAFGITALRTRTALESSEARMRTLFESAPLGITLNEGTKILYANPAYLRMFGYSRLEELVGRDVHDLIAPEFWEGADERMRQGAAGKLDTTRFEALGVRADGTRFPYQVDMGELFSPEGKRIAIGFLADISERKRIEAQTERDQARLTNLYHLSREILSASSPIEVAETAISRIRSLIPCDRASIVLFQDGKADAQVLMVENQAVSMVRPGYRVRLDAEWRAHMEQGEEILVQELSKLDPQKLAPVLVLLQAEGIESYVNIPLLAKGQLVGMFNLGSMQPHFFTHDHLQVAREVGVQVAIALQQATLYEEVQHYAEELEERVAQRTAELEAKNKELESFTYSVSHDLKAPLRGIDGYGRLLLEDYANQLDEEGRLFLSNIRGATQHMSQLIDDLLAYSRVERRQMKYSPVDLQVLVGRLLSAQRDEIEARRVQVTLQLTCTEMQADPEGLEQVLRNLIDNALKFTRHRSDPKIEVGCQTEGDKHIIWVKDNGIGFDMKYHDRLFEIFHRLHRSEDYPGTGIGLAIVAKAMQRMGGRVYAESALNQGATFTLEFVHREDG